MNVIQRAARTAIKQHGSATKAARALKINRTVLVLLSDCKRESASDKTLRKLGLILVPVAAQDVHTSAA